MSSRVGFLGSSNTALRAARDAAFELAWPTRCVGCDEPGTLLCPECQGELAWVEQRWACPVCGAPFGWLTCTECERDWEVRSTVCAFSFRGPAARLVTCYKDEHETRLASVLAATLACALDEASVWDASDGCSRFECASCDGICFVPATSEAFARRGFDHMEPVARRLASELGLPLVDVIVRDSAHDQRALGRVERMANLRGTCEVTDDVSGMRLLLLDDVVTTGASVRAAASALLARGASTVGAAAVSRVW